MGPSRRHTTRAVMFVYVLYLLDILFASLYIVHRVPVRRVTLLGYRLGLRVLSTSSRSRGRRNANTNETTAAGRRRR